MKIKNCKLKIPARHFDTLAHVFLAVGLIIGVVAVYKIRFDATSQFAIILILCAFYLIWAGVYHNLKGDLTRKLAFEYLLIAGIVIAVGFLVFVA